jgi:hypothetical protein
MFPITSPLYIHTISYRLITPCLTYIIRHIPSYKRERIGENFGTTKMSSIGDASSDTADKHETTGETGKMIRLNQPDATWGEQLLKAAADLAATDHDGSDSELSDTDNFLTKGAFLLTPSHELSMEKASGICDKMSFKGLFSLTKTATGILFKFSEPEDFQAVFKKGFHKVTNARFYKKVSTAFQLGILRFPNACVPHFLGPDAFEAETLLNNI